MDPCSSQDFDLRIDSIQGLSQEREVKVACKDVLDFYIDKIANIPPQGPRLIFLHQAGDGWPRARYDGLPDKYNINLTCLNPYSDPSQTIYQFAHELGHVYQWPSDVKRILNWLPLRLEDLQAPWNNWFIESCCCALSFLCLEVMAINWRRSRQRQQLISKVNPREYRNQRIGECLRKLHIRSKADIPDWIHAELPRLTRECLTDNKEEHKLCAIEIEKILREYPDSWGALCHLGDATTDQITSFNRWRDLASPEQHPFINALDQMFNYQMDG